jgi:hypothetical protein
MDLPPDPVVRALIQRYAQILRAFGPEIGTRPLVLPTEEFFPDTFKGDQKSLRRLVRRMQRHAGMEDIPIEPVLVGHDDGDDHDHGKGHACSSQGGGGGCGSGACSVPQANTDSPTRLVDQGDRWKLQMTEAELAHPVAMTTTIARALAFVFLMESRTDDQPLAEPLELTVDLTAVALGFGELMLEGSHIYSKGCGGPSIAKLTALGPTELALVTALFVASGKHSARGLAKHLPPTQREAFDEARALLDSNPSVVELLISNPRRLEDGHFQLGEATSFLSRLFSRKAKTPDEMSLDELEALVARMPTQPKASGTSSRKKKDELADLVEQALADARAEAE